MNGLKLEDETKYESWLLVTFEPKYTNDEIDVVASGIGRDVLFESDASGCAGQILVPTIGEKWWYVATHVNDAMPPLKKFEVDVLSFNTEEGFLEPITSTSTSRVRQNSRLRESENRIVGLLNGHYAGSEKAATGTVATVIPAFPKSTSAKKFQKRVLAKQDQSRVAVRVPGRRGYQLVSEGEA